MVSERIKKAIQFYKKDLEKRIRIEKIILFGSYAKGKFMKDSDIDLIVLSRDFSRMDPDRRLDLLQRARVNPKTWDYGMDIFGFTPKESNKASRLNTLSEIKRSGLVI